MSTRWWTFVVWALVMASATHWGLKLSVRSPVAPPHTRLPEARTDPRADLFRLLGADPPPHVVTTTAEPTPTTRFSLIGVISPPSPQAAREGLALIVVDGKPAKTFRVGQAVDEQSVLLTSVSARGATLGTRDGTTVMTLNIGSASPSNLGGQTAVPSLPSNESAERLAVLPQMATSPEGWPMRQSSSNASATLTRELPPQRSSQTPARPTQMPQGLVPQNLIQPPPAPQLRLRPPSLPALTPNDLPDPGKR